jgi:chromosome segregation ATPase
MAGRCRLVALVAIFGFVVALGGPCWAAPRYVRNPANQAVLREKNELNREASQLQKDVDALKAEVKTDQQEFDKAKKEYDDLKKQVADAEKAVRDAAQKVAQEVEKVEKAQPDDAPLTKLKAAYAAAKETYEKAVEAVEKSTEYQAAYQDAKSSDNRAEALPALRKKWIDGNAAISDARAKAGSAREKYESFRDTVLHKSDAWKDAAEALAAAKKSESEIALKAKTAAQKETAAQAKLSKAKQRLSAEQSKLSKTQSTANHLRAR